MRDPRPGSLGSHDLAPNGRLGPQQAVRDERQMRALDLELARAAGNGRKLLGGPWGRPAGGPATAAGEAQRQGA